jgi:hypothetical protein
MSEEEATFARKIFGNSLPAKEQIILTNTMRPDGRRFTMPGLGGSYFVNLGDAAFRDPIGIVDPGYPQPGQVFVHELTHVWQASHWAAATYFSKALNRDYDPGGGGKAWSDYSLEEQATIVDRWYEADPTFLVGEFRKPFPDFSLKAPHSFDRYIQQNIRAGLA